MLNRNFKESEKLNINIGIQVVLLSVIAVVYIAMLFISASSLGITLQQYLEQNTLAVLDLLSVSTYLLSALVINEYRKNQKQKLIFFGYLIIFGSLIIQSNFLIGGLMGFYLIKHVRMYNFKNVMNNLDNGKGIAAFSLSILVLLISVLLFYIKNIVL